VHVVPPAHNTVAMPNDATNSPTGRPPAWDEDWERAWQASPRAGELVAVRVVRIDKGGITVSRTPGTEQLVVAAKAVRRVVVGDVCGLDPETGRIEEILRRRTVFERRAPGSEREDVSVEAKVLAANMDVVLVLQSLEGGVNTSRLAREMVLAWESGARPVVVLTKADLADGDSIAAERAAAQRFAPEVAVACVSATGPPGTDELDPHLLAGSVAVLLGASGAGKSTLANALAEHEVQLTAEVREGDRRGRHTTTAGQMLELTEDRWLIDTPGIRGVGLLHSDEGLERAFADLAPFAQRCRFDDCTHTAEPGCGIREAIQAGKVGADRLETWRSLVAEVERLEAEAELAEREEKRERNQRSRRRAAAQRGRPRR
jgi:ribosome biogenesis GTPase